MAKVLGLSLYGPLAASHRYRLGQYIPGLAQAGIDLQIHSLLDDAYLAQRFSGQPVAWSQVLQSGFGRLMCLLRRRDYDATILHCELFPLMPGWLETVLLPRPFIYDFDDAFFLKYRQGRFSTLGALLGNKFDRVMARAAAITPGNAYLAEYARAINPNTHILPTVVDTTRYIPQPRQANSIFTVGWIGSPSTAPYLQALVEPLERMGREQPIRFVVVGGRAPSIPGVLVEQIDWDESTEVQLINRFDVGLMPLPDDDWARGKCAFKLIQYMACGVPVVASRIGANVDVVTEECGFLVDDADGWLTALRQLRDQPDVRWNMGLAARERIESSYSLSRNLPFLTDVIRGVLARGG